MIYFFLYLFVEVLVTTQIGALIGGLWMFAEIMASAFIGLIILFNFKSTFVMNIMALKEQRLDAQGFYQNNLFSLLGGILLILPGIVTDVAGILMQFTLLVSLIVNRFTPKYPQPNQPKDDHVIDAEIIDDFPSLR